MRNLKKILALVLALVMSMSLVVTANAFSDDDAINDVYREAASVLNGLEVLKGRPDGSFDPKANISRGEMAAIIYRIVTTDVEDKQTSIYAESSKLSDVPGTWSAGYVGFCNNSNLIMGYPDGTFQPNKNVTGHEALAMLLRAIGYGKNGEFTGANWAINTAIYAKSNGLLKNVNESTLSQPATREMVAEMTFRTLVAENVNWSLGMNYQPANKTLAEGFGLVEFNDVVVANEYADLDGSRPLPAGKTQIGEETYSYASLLTDIGESRHGWACGNAKKVIFIEDAGNTVYENAGAAKDISSTAKFAKVTELSRGGAEEFVNFDSVDEGTYTALIRISYWTDLNKNGQMDEGETGRFPLDKKLTADDRDILKGIFADDAKMEGWVVVGTNDLEEVNDISNEMTWRAFEKEYLEASSKDGIVEGVVNGEWLKVVDNDQDGAADYVFKTTFNVDVVTEIDKKDNVSFAHLDADDYNKVVMPEEIAEGDVVLWTDIDNVAYVTIPESFEAEVKSYSWKNDEITTKDGDVYGQSGIYNSDDPDSVDPDNEDNYLGVFTNIEDAADDRGYVFYKDHFGFVAAFDELTVTNALKLLTDGYYTYGLNKKDVYRVEFWDSEAKDFVRAGVNTKTSYLSNEGKDTFINTDTNTGALSEGWERLIGAVGIEEDEAWTNVAALGMADEIATIKDVDAKSNRSYTYILPLDYVDGIKDGVDGFAAQDRSLKADDTDGTTVLTNASTVFYYVWQNGKNLVITEKVGYKNSVKVADSVNSIHAAYAVVTSTSQYAEEKTNYPVADVVVVEIENPLLGSAELALLFSVNVRNSGEVRSLQTINAGVEKTYSLTGSWTDAQYSELKGNPFTFYNMIGKDGKATAADKIENYPANGIYAGTLNAITELKKGEGAYVVMLDGTELEIPDETPIITFAKGARGTFSADVENTLNARNNGERVIWVEDYKGDVLYVINVDESLQDEDQVIDELDALWEDIDEYEADPELTIDDLLAKMEEAAKMPTDGSATDAQVAAAKELLDTAAAWLAKPEAYGLSKNDIAALETAQTTLQTAYDSAMGYVDLADAQQKLADAIFALLTTTDWSEAAKTAAKEAILTAVKADTQNFGTVDAINTVLESENLADETGVATIKQAGQDAADAVIGEADFETAKGELKTYVNGLLKTYGEEDAQKWSATAIAAAQTAAAEAIDELEYNEATMNAETLAALMEMGQTDFAVDSTGGTIWTAATEAATACMTKETNTANAQLVKAAVEALDEVKFTVKSASTFAEKAAEAVETAVGTVNDADNQVITDVTFEVTTQTALVDNSVDAPVDVVVTITVGNAEATQGTATVNLTVLVTVDSNYNG